MCWSHVKSAPYGSGCCSEMITRGVVARYNCCSKPNEADPSSPVYKDTSASMEGFGAQKVFEELQDKLKIIFACFDGDASTPRHLYSYHPDARAVRDPNHIAKNVYKQLKSVYKELNYSCSCCAHVLNKNGTKSMKKTHNPITDKKAKSAQVWVGKILRESTSQQEARKLLENFLDHLEGKCQEGGGCQHSFPYEHPCPINCPEMMERIRSYFKTQVDTIWIYIHHYVAPKLTLLTRSSGLCTRLSSKTSVRSIQTPVKASICFVE